jgi:hypothetical protein
MPLMDLINEFKDYGFKVYREVPRVHCTFEDNSGALKLARLPKLHPHTKHINIKNHHFCEHVQLGLIKVYPIGTNDQIADIFTKPLAQNLFPEIHKKSLHF